MAIQQHPVPQDISNYKFRLIGDMTIKQFASLGIGIVLSVMIYSSPLPFFFKYPLSFIILLLGVGMAFVPFQGRTLDVWIIAFIKSIYSPTQYIWKHGHIDPKATQEAVTPPTNTIANDVTPQTPVITVTPPATDDAPVIPTASIESAVQTIAITQTPTPPTTTEGVTQTVEETTSQVTAPQVADVVQNNIGTVVEEVKTTLPEAQPIPEEIKDLSVEQEPTPKTEPAIPEKPADYSSLPIPFTPTTPNTLVGLTLTPEGKTLDGVLVEIKNQNLTLRATKSNKLGQFLFVRPLENGLYQILAEKDDYIFETYSIELTGEIINPLRLQAINTP